MTYKDTTEYLFNQMPMFERQGASGYKEGLSNTLALDEHFGHPHQNYLTIHIACTNGKGSCAHTIAAILQTCGYKVGLYTSPHLVDFRERIRVDGHEISEKYVVDFVERERRFFEPLHPSFFEVTTAMAFKYFSDMKVDVAVIEVGLGGRLDCTNIITPTLSVITNISLDHTQFLGDTPAKIAAEKAGIIKKGVPTLIGEATDETRPVFIRKAGEIGAPIVFAEEYPEIKSYKYAINGGITYETEHWGEIYGELGGSYQAKNTNTIMHAVRILMKQGVINGNHDTVSKAIHTAFAEVTRLTGFAGRWQKVKDNPLVICDAGHNAGGWEWLAKQLAEIRCHKKHIVFGMVNDKDIDSVLSLLPKDAVYHFTRPESKRAMSESRLTEMAVTHGLRGTYHHSVKEAYESALQNTSEDDFIFVGGSCYVVADFLKECV